MFSPMAQPRSRRAEATAEAALIILVLGLVAVGVFVGWIVGHYTTSGTTTVTVSRSTAVTTAASPTTTAAAAPTTTAAAAPTTTETTGGAQVAALGKTVFTQNCGSCHTLAAAGTSGTVGPNLDQLKPSVAVVQHQVVNGGAVMPAFAGTLSTAQIAAVATYVSSVAGQTP
jgi:mono/diheme cytochrome c family protein